MKRLRAARASNSETASLEAKERFYVSCWDSAIIEAARAAISVLQPHSTIGSTVYKGHNGAAGGISQ